MITRRSFLKRVLACALGANMLGGGYAVGAGPFGLRIQRYRLTPPVWPRDLRLRIAVLADFHACEPWMSVDRIAGIVERTNALRPELTVLLGDYTASHSFAAGRVPAEAWAAAIAPLKAPLGVYAILGNHDWWDDPEAQRRGDGPTVSQRALERANIPVLENRAVPLRHSRHRVWLAGLGDQLALRPSRHWGRARWQGRDDLPATLAQVTDDAPVILLAHEPDIFPAVPDRVALTLSGHTHGGQVRLLGYSPVVPSRHGNRFAYGLVSEAGPDGAERHMIVSGGLGCSIMPVRFGVPPEIVLVELGASTPKVAGKRGGRRSAGHIQRLDTGATAR